MPRLLSEEALGVIRALVDGRREEVDAFRPASGMGQREWREFMETLGFTA